MVEAEKDPMAQTQSFFLKRKDPFCYGTFLAIILLAFGYVYLKNAWVGDDACITFRTIDNLLAGYGLTWNVDERVQVFTYPLWMLLMVALRWITGEFYYSVLALSFLLTLGSLILAVNPFRNELPKALTIFLILISSKAFVDYSSSGLENPLSYLLLSFFYASLIMKRFLQEFSARKVLFCSLMTAIGYLTRPDLVIFIGVPCVYVCYRAIQEHVRGWLGMLVLGLLPAFLWMLFALVYYGFVFPNSYYAKVAVALPIHVLAYQGLSYLWVSVLFDPITPVIILLGLLIPGFGSKSIEVRLAQFSVTLYLLYVVYIGGDFMSGRFLAAPFMVSAFILVAELNFKTSVPYLLCSAGIVVYNIVAPLAPSRGISVEGWRYERYYGVCDERGHYARASSIKAYREWGSVRDQGAEDGKMFRQHPHSVWLAYGLGYMGFYAGPGVILIDVYGITDPLLARLPVPDSMLHDFRPGHIVKSVPKGYPESRVSGGNAIEDVRIHQFYDKLRLVTAGPIFSSKRWGYIYDLNLGRDAKFMP
jgi:arabinofuranosyltransferase